MVDLPFGELDFTGVGQRDVAVVALGQARQPRVARAIIVIGVLVARRTA
jgi:hypothetical protein